MGKAHSRQYSHKRRPILIGLISTFSALTLIFNSVSSAQAEPSGNITLKPPEPRTLKTRPDNDDTRWKKNTLLVMPFDSEGDDAKDIIREVGGNVVRTIGSGEMTVWVVEFESEKKFAAAEKKLSEDKNIESVQRDYFLKSNQSANDPFFPQCWHLPSMNIPAAWSSSGGANVIIGVIDTGVTSGNQDLQGKVYQGYNSMTGAMGQSDPDGHGTMVATVAAARTNNGVLTASPARLAYIYPVRAGTDSGFSTSALLEGILHLGNQGVRLVNLSVNGTPPFSIANKKVFSALHKYFKWFHKQKGGLIFNAAGNDGIFDTNKQQKYLIVVSAVNQSHSLSNFSNYGYPVWFTAPGSNIYCSRGTNQVVSVSGTSFSCPLVCAVAAMVWSANPALTNVQVEAILKANSANSTKGWNQYYGWGMPDAAACISHAQSITASTKKKK